MGQHPPGPDNSATEWPRLTLRVMLEHCLRGAALGMDGGNEANSPPSSVAQPSRRLDETAAETRALLDDHDLPDDRAPSAARTPLNLLRERPGSLNAKGTIVGCASRSGS